MAEKTQKYAEAITHYKSILELNPDDNRVLTRLEKISEKIKSQKEKNIKEGQILLEQENYYQAIKRWEVILPLLGGEQKKILKKRLDAAQAELKKRVESTRDEINKYKNTKNYTKNIKTIERLLLLTPNDLNMRRELKIVKGKLRASQTSAREAKSGDIRKHFTKGIDYYKSGKYKQAIASWNKVLALDNHNDKAKSYIGRAKMKLELLGE